MKKENTRRGFTQINWVGQALPDNAPVKRHPSSLISGKNTPYCQVEPDLHKRRAGFTLIELLVVVLIIGILAAVAVPQYQKAVEKARATEAVLTISTLEKAIDRWILENGIPSNTTFFLGDGSNSYYTYGNLDIELSCEEENQYQCVSKNFTYDAYMTTPGLQDIVAHRRNDDPFYVLHAQRTGTINTWTRKCGYSGSVSKAVCDSLVPNGWESLEEYDY